jgi:enamine deaminase RidA (YjgF/YER057c/UK114 family)
MSRHQLVQPPHFPKARGYSNGVIAQGRTLYVAGQVGSEPDWSFKSPELAAQFARALDNVLDVVREAGGQPTDIVRMTVYVTDLPAYRASVTEIGVAWRERMGKHYPAMALVGVAGLVLPEAKVEIEATAVLPDAG